MTHPHTGRVRFRTTVELGGKTATGLAVPDHVVSELGHGKRPAVQVTIAGHSYRTTIAPMGGRFFVPLSAENRAAAGVVAGDDVDVDIIVDATPREVIIPADLLEALEHEHGVREFFDELSYTHRKEWVRWIEDAKKADTRSRRVEQTVGALRAGQRTR